MRFSQPRTRDHNGDVEAQLRARSVQLRQRAVAEGDTDALGTPRKPLGCCRRCSAVVYTGDSLAMVGGYLVHGECA